MSKYGGRVEVYTVLVGKPEGKRSIWKTYGSTTLNGSWDGGVADEMTRHVGYINLVQNGDNWQTLVKREEPADPITY